jgi:hypothetical protein
MLRKSFTGVLILTLSMACIAQAAPLQDDTNTFALWHGDTITGSSTPDDTSITIRTPHAMTINGGNASVTQGTGYYGGALDFGTDGRQMGSVGTTWPLNTAVDNAMGNEIKMDGWFYLPSRAYLPIPTSAGGSGAATMYMFQIASSSAGGTRCYLAGNPKQNTGTRVGYAGIDWQKTNNGSTITLPVYNYSLNTGLPFAPGDANYLDLTGKWIHIVCFAQYSATPPSWDASYNRSEMDITDPSIGTTYTVTGNNSGYLTGSNSNIWIGQISGKINTGAPLYRGYRGLIDDLKLSGRVHAPMVAYGPTPLSGSTVGVSSNMAVSWHPAAPYNPAGTVYQDIWLSTKSTFSKTDPNWTKVASGLTGSTGNIGSVAFGKTYYWVVDSNDAGTYTASAVWNFNVNDIAPTVVLPSDKVTYLSSGTSTLSITSTVTDPDTNLGLLTYQWTQIGAAPAATIASPTSKDTNITFSAVGSYFFQLTANDGTFPGSDIIRVQVFNTPCEAAQASLPFSFQSADFDESCKVTFTDFATLAASWQKCNALGENCY